MRTGFLAISTLVAATLLVGGPATAKDIIHDAEHYLLAAQHGDRWAVEDKDLDAKLAALEKKFGTKPNIIHIMWDDTAVGEIGIPEIQKVRGFAHFSTLFESFQPRSPRKICTIRNH